ncbi:hypothetical protein [Pseudoduganella violaceinigra]|uniref:hypothetical protein n=1 Tax=Pseudoduganella violaceinigra TaxID=246602 RepID=UPI0012B51FAD|nr:hypothetical protein [Pseudoduganella violaceinigra]
MIARQYNALQLSRNPHSQSKSGKQSSKAQVRFLKQQRQQQQLPAKKQGARARQRAHDAAAQRNSGTSPAPKWGTLQWLVFFLALSAIIAPGSATPTLRRNRCPALPGDSDQPLLGMGADAMSVDQFRTTEMQQLQSQLKVLHSELPTCPTLRDIDGVKDQMEQLYTMTPSDYLNRAVCRVNPSQGKGHVVAMVGLPGSGKSTKQGECTALGYTEYDDIGKNWDQLHQVRAEASSGTNIVMSDIMLTQEAEKLKTQERLGPKLPVNYVHFENNPKQCERNARFRKQTNGAERNLDWEIHLINQLSANYRPPANALPVFVAPTADNESTT